MMTATGGEVERHADGNAAGRTTAPINRTVLPPTPLPVAIVTPAASAPALPITAVAMPIAPSAMAATIPVLPVLVPPFLFLRIRVVSDQTIRRKQRAAEDEAKNASPGPLLV